MNTRYAFSIIFLIYVSYSEEIRFCSIGMGHFGSFTAKLAIEKGFKMVAAFTRYSKHTKTVGELLGMKSDESLSFEVSGMNKLEEIIDKTNPHFCIDATNSTLEGVFSHFRRLIAKNIHILTLSDEAVFPNTRFDWQSRQLYKTLDTLSKKHNVVIVGGGYSDSIFMPVIPSLTASMQRLSKIRITLRINVEDREAETYGVGLTANEFKEFAKTSRRSANIEYWERSVVEAIGDEINFPILEMEDDYHHKTLQLYTRKECYKVENENGLFSKVINKLIPFGDCGGMNVTVLGKARDNLEIVQSVIFAIITDDDEINDVEVELSGVPDLTFSIRKVDSFYATAASLLHRVPMVLNELKPGFYNVNHLKSNKYWATIDDWTNDTTENKQDL
eukprot:53410_1